MKTSKIKRCKKRKKKKKKSNKKEKEKSKSCKTCGQVKELNSNTEPSTISGVERLGNLQHGEKAGWFHQSYRCRECGKKFNKSYFVQEFE